MYGRCEPALFLLPASASYQPLDQASSPNIGMRKGDGQTGLVASPGKDMVLYLEQPACVHYEEAGRQHLAW